MAWILLLLAALLEIVWAMGLKWSDGLTKLWPSVVTVTTMIASFVLLAAAVRTIPIGTGYAVWTGIGAAGAMIFGAILFGEVITLWRGACLLMIVCGVVGLKLGGQ